MTNILMFSHYCIGSHNKFRNEYVHERDRSCWWGVETKRGKAEMVWTYAGGAYMNCWTLYPAIHGYNVKGEF